METTDYEDGWYDGPVRELRYRQKPGESTVGDRKAIRFDYDGAGQFAWDFWTLMPYGWASNPFGKLSGKDIPTYTEFREKAARYFVETGKELP